MSEPERQTGDQRKSVRASVEIEAELRTLDPPTVAIGTIRNLNSVGGTFVVTDAQFPVGALIRLRFEVPISGGSSFRHTIDTSAVIVWAQQAGEDKERGVGLKIQDLGAAERNLISNLVDSAAY